MSSCSKSITPNLHFHHSLERDLQKPRGWERKRLKTNNLDKSKRKNKIGYRLQDVAFTEQEFGHRSLRKASKKNEKQNYS